MIVLIYILKLMLLTLVTIAMGCIGAFIVWLTEDDKQDKEG